jgi:hypothetical protein
VTPGGRISRRRFLGTVAGIGGSALAIKARPWRALVAFEPVSVAERLAGLLAHRDSARIVGTAYLDRVPSEASATRLLDGIAARLPEGRGTIREASDDDLRAFLAASIRSDFEDDRVVEVDGWVLSPTEARLYALTTLV